MVKAIVNGVILPCLLVGCQNLTGAQDVRPMHLSENTVIIQNQADVAKEIVLSMKEVVEIKGVPDNEDHIYLAIKVKHFDRFRLQEI